MTKFFKTLATALLVLGVSNASAVVISSTNTADFNLTLETFPGGTGAPFTNDPIVSVSGNITVDNADFLPTTGSAKFTENFAALSGLEYIVSGDENFDLSFSSLQNAFAINYLDEGDISTFSLTFFDGLTNVGSTSFVTPSIGAAEFIGFISTVAFDRVEIREDIGGFTNEAFQFYSAEAVSEPGALAVFSIGIVGLGYMRRRKAIK
tara:strand:+ start:56786 stop:57406 length:621 start_codon:yes stop_codon:yes gene_type:complete